MSVGLGGGKSLELTYETTPYLVTSTGEPPGLAGNLMAWVQDLFMDSHRDHGVDPAQSMVIRSYQAPEKLSFPLLNKVGKQKIAVGQSIILSWQGGQKPYGIRVLAAGRQAPLLEMHGLLDGRVQLDSAAWVPGSYSVEISAGQDRDQVVAGEFEVVDADIVPAVPANYAEELDASSMPENSKAVLRSAWLSKQGDGEWSLQAYQQVVALPQSYYPAYLLQQSLVLGE